MRGAFDRKVCVIDGVADSSRSRSSFRKGLENGIAHDVEEVSAVDACYPRLCHC